MGANSDLISRPNPVRQGMQHWPGGLGGAYNGIVHQPGGDGFADGKGIRLHYLEWGSSGQPAVLLHATGFLARLWGPVAVGLSSRFHVYGYDNRGHGDSERPGVGSYDWFNLADDLGAFLRALDLPRAVLVGHSSGGAVAAYLAATAPERVAGLALIEPIAPRSNPPGMAMAQVEELAKGAEKRRLLWPSREAVIASYRKKPLFSLWPESMLDLYVTEGTRRRADGQFELKCPGEVEAEIYRKSLLFNVLSVLPEINCPTLVIRGELTQPHLARMSETVAKGIAGAELVTLEEAGHLSPMERPEALTAELLRFFDVTAGS